MLLILTNLNVQKNLSSSLTSSTKVQGRIPKILLFKEYGLGKLSIRFLHWNFGGPQMPELFVIWTHLDFRSHVSPKALTSLFLSESQNKTSSLFRINPVKVRFISFNGVLMYRKIEKFNISGPA